MEMSDIEFGRTYSQADISGLFENIFRFRIPDRFMPDGSLISLGQIMFGNDVVVSQAVMPPHPYTNQSDFLERQPQGYYAIGHWGHGLNSYRFCYRVAERNRVIWLEIPYGGVFQNEEQDARDIESYLSELVSFLEKADRAGIDVEVIDPRTLVPLDRDLLIESVKKTEHVVIAQEAVRRGGVASDLASIIQEEAFDYLDAPIQIVAGKNTPIPYNKSLESSCIPQEEDIAAGVKRAVYADQPVEDLS